MRTFEEINRIMRLLNLLSLSLLLSMAANAQVFHNNGSSGCDIEVAYAVSEAEGTGEYTMTDLILITPGNAWDFSMEALRNRNLFAGEDYEVMFIVRYPSTGLTFYVDADARDGYERLVSGCTGSPKVVYTRNGEFHFDDANN